MRECRRPSAADSFTAILADYRARIRPGRQGAEARYRRMPDLQTAIHHAALALREGGKMESHQCRVGALALRGFEAALQRRASRGLHALKGNGIIRHQ